MNVSPHNTPNAHSAAPTNTFGPEATPPATASCSTGTSVAGPTCGSINPDITSGTGVEPSASVWLVAARPSISSNANPTLVMSLIIKKCSFSVERGVRAEETIANSLQCAPIRTDLEPSAVLCRSCEGVCPIGRGQHDEGVDRQPDHSRPQQRGDLAPQVANRRFGEGPRQKHARENIRSGIRTGCSSSSCRAASPSCSSRRSLSPWRPCRSSPPTPSRWPSSACSNRS